MNVFSEVGAMNATELLDLYRTKKISPVEVTKDVLSRIERLNPTVNAFCHLDADQALDDAIASEQRWMRGEPQGIIDGVPCTVKDLVLVRGMPTRRGSRSTPADVNSEVDAPVVVSLRASGGIVLGKTNTAEFGWKGVTDNPLNGTTRNPWDTRMTPGGSSGGAAAAAALNLGVLHVGTDAGGSVRIPGSFSGVVGMKPTFGYVPQWPASAMGALSHIGPITRTVEDAAIMQTVMARSDPRDTTIGEPRTHDWAGRVRRDVKGLRIAYSPTLGYAAPAADVRARADQCAELLADLGANVELVDPGFHDPTDAFEKLWYAGAANAVGKIDPSALSELDPGLLKVAQAGTKLSVIEYLRAIDTRNEIAEIMAEFHQHWDILLTPTVAVTAFEAGRNVPGGWPSDNWTSWSPYCHPFNLTQQPAISIPFGYADNGLPVGIQLVAARFRDDLIFGVANAICEASPTRFLAEPRTV